MRVFFFIFFSIIFSLGALAQKMSDVTEVRNGKKYYVHTVQKGETVYGLTRIYKTSDEVIYRENPGSEQGIKVGQKLYIPFPAQGEPAKPPVVGTTPQKSVKHTVQKGETLYGIGKRYGISVDALVAANPKVEGGLRTGDVLIIPGSTQPETGTVETPAEKDEEPETPVVIQTPVKDPGNIRVLSRAECAASPARKDEYNIAVLLPLGFEAGPQSKHGRIAMQFYAGIRLAIEKYEPRKATINWRFFSTGGKMDEASVKSITQKADFRLSDLVIGPLYTSEMAPVLQYAADNKIPVISPFSRGNDILENNPYVLKASLSEETYTASIARFLNQRYKNGKVILLNTGLKKDSVFYQMLRDTLVLKYRFDSVTANRNLVYLPKGGNVAAFIKKDVPNICVYPTNKEITVNSFFSGLNKIGKTNDFAVLGEESWFNFRNFDVEHFNNCKIHIPVVYKTFDWDSTHASFIRNFREKYNTEPEFYAFRAYETACLAIDLLEQYGNATVPCLQYDEHKYLITPFRWRKLPGGGYENTGMGMMILENYEIRYEAY